MGAATARGSWRGALLISVCFGLASAADGRAQPAVSTVAAGDVLSVTEANLRRELGRGDVVSIVQSTGETVTGRVLRVSDTVLELRSDPTSTGGQARRLDLSIPLSEIASLDRPRDSLRNGMLIGAGIGAGVGIGFLSYTFAVDANESDEWLAVYMVGTAAVAGIGALVGLAIDAVHSKPGLRYRREGVTSAVRVGPIFAHGRGVAVVVTF